MPPKTNIKLPYKMLIYDIETGLLKAYLFRLGEQRINHGQLDPAFNITPIISIAYKWYGEKETYVLSGENAVEEFDKIARKADVCLGKNNIRFDVKHINTQRMLQNLKPFPEWMDATEDLERQLRKYFAFPSQSLDYISGILGFGGKDKMEFSDWVHIANYQLFKKISSAMSCKTFSTQAKYILSMELFNQSHTTIVKKGTAALNKMLKYNKKDVLDTEKILKRVLPYITLKYNASNEQGCYTCGSLNLKPTEIIVKGKTKYQQWECLSHGGYGGKCTWYYKKGSHHKTYSKMGA